MNAVSLSPGGTLVMVVTVCIVANACIGVAL